MMAFLYIVQITSLYCSICLFIPVYSTTKRSHVHYQLNDTFYSGKLGLNLLPKPTSCEKIKVPICQNGVGYLETLLPNIFEDRNQHQAGLSLNKFQLLLDIGCSSYLRKFLCSLYLPICSLPFRNEPIPPCHHLCAKVRNDCTHFLDIVGFPWPAELNCEHFPKSGLCVGPSIDSIEDNSTINTILESFPQKYLIPNINKKKQDTDDKSSVVSSNLLLGINGLQMICGRLCVGITYINPWIKFYSILCLLSTCWAVCIFISNMKKYLYPERTLVWMSGCYMVLSTAYIIECFTQEQMVLTLSETTNSSSNNTNSSITSPETTWSFSNIETQWQIPTHDNVLSDVPENNEESGCIFYFVIQNISMAAACLWWTMASISSYLFVTHGRGFVEKVSPLLHLLVWCFSSFFPIMMALGFVYSFKNGFCSLSTFLNTFFLLCCLFFFLLFRIKEVTQELGITTNWDRKMKYFSEICVFTFLVIVVCQLIELDEKGKLRACPELNINPETCFQNIHRLNNVLKVKYFMLFFPGIASGICMFLTRQKKVRCECPSDDNDYEEIHL